MTVLLPKLIVPLVEICCSFPPVVVHIDDCWHKSNLPFKGSIAFCSHIGQGNSNDSLTSDNCPDKTGYVAAAEGLIGLRKSTDKIPCYGGGTRDNLTCMPDKGMSDHSWMNGRGKIERNLTRV